MFLHTETKTDGCQRGEGPEGPGGNVQTGRDKIVTGM